VFGGWHGGELSTQVGNQIVQLYNFGFEGGDLGGNVIGRKVDHARVVEVDGAGHVRTVRKIDIGRKINIGLERVWLDDGKRKNMLDGRKRGSHGSHAKNRRSRSGRGREWCPHVLVRVINLHTRSTPFGNRQ